MQHQNNLPAPTQPDNQVSWEERLDNVTDYIIGISGAYIANLKLLERWKVEHINSWEELDRGLEALSDLRELRFLMRLDFEDAQRSLTREDAAISVLQRVEEAAGLKPKAENPAERTSIHAGTQEAERVAQSPTRPEKTHQARKKAAGRKLPPPPAGLTTDCEPFYHHEYGHIRTAVRGGKRYFHCNDIADCLGYARGWNLFRDHGGLGEGIAKVDSYNYADWDTVCKVVKDLPDDKGGRRLLSLVRKEFGL